jgi:hypothetical protein
MTISQAAGRWKHQNTRGIWGFPNGSLSSGRERRLAWSYCNTRQTAINWTTDSTPAQRGESTQLLQLGWWFHWRNCIQVEAEECYRFQQIKKGKKSRKYEHCDKENTESWYRWHGINVFRLHDWPVTVTRVKTLRARNNKPRLICLLNNYIIEHLLHARYCSGHWRCKIEQSKVPASVELTF